jgi:hypothetical protein
MNPPYQLHPDSDELPRLPLRLAASNAQQGMLIVVAIALTALGIWVAQEHPVIGYLGVAFFASGAVTAALELMLNRNYLEITEQGFVVVRLLRSYRLTWGDVSHFSVVTFVATSSVAWDYSAKVPHRPALAWVNRMIIGADGTLRNYASAYGFSPKGFALLLNGLRDRYA